MAAQLDPQRILKLRERAAEPVQQLRVAAQLDPQRILKLDLDWQGQVGPSVAAQLDPQRILKHHDLFGVALVWNSWQHNSIRKGF